MQQILYLLLALAIFGFILYLITKYIPMPEIVRNIIIAIAVIVLILWFIQNYGGLPRVNLKAP